MTFVAHCVNHWEAINEELGEHYVRQYASARACMEGLLVLIPPRVA
jgi:hypothetical protein